MAAGRGDELLERIRARGPGATVSEPDGAADAWAPRYFWALDRNATRAWIWLGLSVLLKVFGMMPDL